MMDENGNSCVWQIWQAPLFCLYFVASLGTQPSRTIPNVHVHILIHIILEFKLPLHIFIHKYFRNILLIIYSHIKMLQTYKIMDGWFRGDCSGPGTWISSICPDEKFNLPNGVSPEMFFF
jgi:hypothetical protein